MVYEGVKSRTNERKQNIVTVLKDAWLLYDELISTYKKEYNQIFKSKDKDWK